MGRDRDLAGSLVQQARACCQVVQAVLVCTDGWRAYLKSLMHAFRAKVK
jgi:IS1 family transposase